MIIKCFCNKQETQEPLKAYRSPTDLLWWSPNLQVAFPIPKVYQGYTKGKYILKKHIKYLHNSK